MLKRIIFDFDNTLVTWKEEYNHSIIKAYRKFGIELTLDKYNEFDRLLRRYEKEFTTFDKDKMTKFFNDNYSLGMPDDYIDEWLKELEKCIPEDLEELIETLKYLKQKYELVILTNWFTSSQVGRLKNMGIIDYFDEVIGADTMEKKPAKSAFIYALGNHSFEECVMIGDSIEIDLLTPKELGMETILITDKDIYYEKKIKKIKDLKEML